MFSVADLQASVFPKASLVKGTGKRDFGGASADFTVRSRHADVVTFYTRNVPSASVLRSRLTAMGTTVIHGPLKRGRVTVTVWRAVPGPTRFTIYFVPTDAQGPINELALTGPFPPKQPFGMVPKRALASEFPVPIHPAAETQQGGFSFHAAEGVELKFASFIAKARFEDLVDFYSRHGSAEYDLTFRDGTRTRTFESSDVNGSRIGIALSGRPHFGTHIQFTYEVPAQQKSAVGGRFEGFPQRGTWVTTQDRPGSAAHGLGRTRDLRASR